MVEYLLSNDLDVTLWNDFRIYNGETPLRTVYGGDYVVVNTKLHNMFDDFKRNQSSLLNRGSLISCNALMDTYKNTQPHSLSHSESIKMNGKTYILMDVNEIDALCEWILKKRDEVEEKGRSNILAALSENKVNSKQLYYNTI